MDEEFLDGMGGFQIMGIMNAFKTGDVQTDMIIAMCMPFLLKFLFGFFGQLDGKLNVQKWIEWWGGKSHEYERFISHKTTRNYWGGTSSLDEDTQNSVLLKAIKLYLHQVVKLKLKRAYLDLTGIEDQSSSSYGWSSDEYDSDSSDDDSEYGASRSRKTLVGMLSRYTILKNLPEQQWHALGEYGSLASMVELRIENLTHQEEKGKDSKLEISNLTFHFASSGDGAIDDFIDTAYQWYMGELRKLEDNSRYIYELKMKEIKLGGNKDGCGSGDEGCSYMRYKLSDHKTFESLFFRQKEGLLNSIQHFTERTGKYAIKGYPHKLGVLLHGPPGTGKTSLIKALAQHTGRSIVNVPLSLVSTNSELMSIFFDRNYHIEGADVPIKLGFKDVIFVMEDVDAASKVVKRRDGRKTADVVETETLDLPVPKSMWRMLLETSDSECKELVKKLMEKSERLRKEAQKPEVLLAIAQRMMILPALGLVGEGSSDDPTLAKLSQEAVESASNLMSNYSTVDSFVSGHARAIKSLLESGAEIDEAFVDELLGKNQPNVGESAITVSKPNSLSRDVSYTKYGDSSKIHLENKAKEEAALSSIAYLMGTEGATSSTEIGSSTLMGPSAWSKPNKDQLTLSGLLNVLDGVVDTPGRILIMTTNHPEMLDPALIRPGRIDKKIMLGYMASTDVICMLEHYFQTSLGNKDVSRIETIINGGLDGTRSRLNLTPAQVEQLAAEHDDLEDMLDALEEMGHSCAPKKKYGMTHDSAIAYGV